MKKVLILLTVLILIIAGVKLMLMRGVNEVPPATQNTPEAAPENNTPANNNVPPEASVTYKNASGDLIKVGLPYPGAVVGKDFSVIGQARGSWYFEASFPVQVLDKNGNILAQTPAQAQGEWMTKNFVPFKADIKIPQTYIGPATLILKNDNPSGDPSRDKSVSFPITIEY
jgi:hypothetical protein